MQLDEEKQGPEAPIMSDNQTCIMVIDDDPYVLEMLCEILRGQGYKIRSDTNPESGLQSVFAHPPDLVLLDVRMPEMDGFEVCEAIKKNTTTSHVPVIFISSLFEPEEKVKAFEVGAADFLNKPFSAIEVSARVRAQLKLYRWNASLEDTIKQRTEELEAAVIERRKGEAYHEKLLAELKAKNRELEHFAYSISHDLKTPMITILGFIERIEKDIAEGRESNVHDDVQRISTATRKMQKLLDGVLELSRIGRIVNPPVEVAMGELALEVVQRFEGQVNKGKVAVDVDAAMPLVQADRSRLEQVYQNLIGNALSFMGEQKKPHIEIGSETKNAETVFFVRDNGIGIEPQFHEKIFLLFDKLDAKGKGTGVGLALCKRIIEAHGGRIWVESPGKGKGSAFYFTLSSAPEVI